MYTRFFGLKHSPFSIAPDPRYLFMSERHREALAHLLYGLNGGGGFVLLTGEIGAGKTTVCRLFLEQIPERCNVAYIFNPKQTVIELLQSICDEFGVKVKREVGAAVTVKDFVDPLNRYLLATHAVHQNNVLIIDEAQNLSADVLEQLRLLTNLETSERKLLQIILIGQPELRTMLARPELEQLAQRIIARFHLGALTAAETAQYIAHRLAVAGIRKASPFSQWGIRRIHQRARGVPRRINVLCDRALLGAYASGKTVVDTRTIDAAAREVFDFHSERGVAHPLRRGTTVFGVVAGAALLAGGVIMFNPTAMSNRISAAPLPSVGSSSAQRLDVVKPLAPATTALPVVAERAAPLVGDDARDLPAAYRRLAQLWQITLTGADPCTSADKQNVHCFSSTKGLAEIRQLDRPGILTLHDDAQQNYYALLLGLSNENAVIQIGRSVETVSLAALSHRWRGEFMTFWRGPTGYRKDLARGDQGPEIDWLAAQLARLNGAPTPSANAVYDDTLSTRIREFQIAQGLQPDGLAGPQTLMRLASLAGIPEPHLQAAVLATQASVRK